MRGCVGLEHLVAPDRSLTDDPDAFKASLRVLSPAVARMAPFVRVEQAVTILEHLMHIITTRASDDEARFLAADLAVSSVIPRVFAHSSDKPWRRIRTVKDAAGGLCFSSFSLVHGLKTVLSSVLSSGSISSVPFLCVVADLMQKGLLSVGSGVSIPDAVWFCSSSLTLLGRTYEGSFIADSVKGRVRHVAFMMLTELFKYVRKRSAQALCAPASPRILFRAIVAIGLGLETYESAQKGERGASFIDASRPQYTPTFPSVPPPSFSPSTVQQMFCDLFSVLHKDYDILMDLEAALRSLSEDMKEMITGNLSKKRPPSGTVKSNIYCITLESGSLYLISELQVAKTKTFLYKDGKEKTVDAPSSNNNSENKNTDQKKVPEINLTITSNSTQQSTELNTTKTQKDSITKQKSENSITKSIIITPDPGFKISIKNEVNEILQSDQIDDQCKEILKQQLIRILRELKDIDDIFEQ